MVEDSRDEDRVGDGKSLVGRWGWRHDCHWGDDGGVGFPDLVPSCSEYE